MDAITCFIGVVSHASSGFGVNQGPEGLGSRLAQALSDLGCRSEVVVNTGNLWDERLDPGALDSQWAVNLDRSAVQRSLTEQLALERRWSGYLGHPPSLRDRFRNTALRLGRLRRLIQSPAPSTLRRLLNIELSHLDLWQRGVKSGASWILVFEDDAFSADIHDLAAGIVGLTSESCRLAYVNMSRSFDASELRIENLLRHEQHMQWHGSQHRELLIAARPITNTVCAIAYHRDFLIKLLETWRELPVDPVVPIDWKLNEALMQMHRKGDFALSDSEFGACLIVMPEPIVQGSMSSGIEA